MTQKKKVEQFIATVIPIWSWWNRDVDNSFVVYLTWRIEGYTSTSSSAATYILGIAFRDYYNATTGDLAVSSDLRHDKPQKLQYYH